MFMWLSPLAKHRKIFSCSIWHLFEYLLTNSGLLLFLSNIIIMSQFLILIQGFQIMSHHGHPPLHKIPNPYIWLDHKEAKRRGQLCWLIIFFSDSNWCWDLPSFCQVYLSLGTKQQHDYERFSIINHNHLKQRAESSAVFTSGFPMFGNIVKFISATKMLLLDFPAHPTMGRLQTTWMESLTLKGSFKCDNDARVPGQVNYD